MTIRPRYLPNTRESADEIKRRVWQHEDILVVDLKSANLPWDMKEYLRAVGSKLYGPRKAIIGREGREG